MIPSAEQLAIARATTGFVQDLLIVKQAQEAMDSLIALEPLVKEMGGREKVRIQIFIHSQFINEHLKKMVAVHGIAAAKQQ